MVVVGHRQAKDGLHVLLQNWWDNKQFVDVNQAYWSACLPVPLPGGYSRGALFVKTPQTRTRNAFTTTRREFDTISLDAVDGVDDDTGYHDD